MPPDPSRLWSFLVVGYLLAVAIEVPVLLVGLSRRHSLGARLVAGLWLTACTYPIVVVVLPYLVWKPYGRPMYIAVAETFAVVTECVLFWLVFRAEDSQKVKPHLRRSVLRDLTAIVVANLCSFFVGTIVRW